MSKINKKIIINHKEALDFKNCTLTYGHFDLVHTGHIRYLRNASKEGNRLVIALLPDTYKGIKYNYQFSQYERAEGLTSFDFIDAIILLKDEVSSLQNLINFINPNILLLGTEFQNSNDPEIVKARDTIKKLKKELKYHAGVVQYASTKLLDNPKEKLNLDNITKFKYACKKQNLFLNDLINSIKSWRDTRILVIGDTILDQYAACDALGMSAEAPVLVVKELQTKNFKGGAAIVASHINSLGAKCEFLSVVGNDENGKLIEKELRKENIKAHLIRDNSRATTFKKRYMVENQKLFRVSKLNDHSLNSIIEEKILKKLEDIATNIDGIIISDFVYGVITEKIIEKVLALSKKYQLKIFGDLQCSSQLGLVTKFKNFSLLSPNEREARIALQDNDSGLETISMELIKITKSENLIMKLGSDGLIAYEKKSSDRILRQSFPSLSTNPLDVSGAGDALLALVALALCSGDNLMSAAALGSCMSAIAVETMGNRPIDDMSLKNFVMNILSPE